MPALPTLCFKGKLDCGALYNIILFPTYLCSRNHVWCIKSNTKDPNKYNGNVNVFHLEVCFVPYWVNQLKVSTTYNNFLIRV